MLRLDALVSSRHLPNNVVSSRKFLQILASISTVGLVEPVIVARIVDDEGRFRILDGRLRVEAVRRLNSTEVLLLICTES
ncbi:ParB N-terminal domain-containing protein [Paraburkholderia nemoris]